MSYIFLYRVYLKAKSRELGGCGNGKYVGRKVGDIPVCHRISSLRTSTRREPGPSVGCCAVHKEYPNKISHTLNSDADVAPARKLTPAFYGCYDWHSSVHGHWLLVRLVRTFPSASFAPPAREALRQSLTAENIAQEAAYLRADGRASFERPYGLAWLLQLAAELREWEILGQLEGTEGDAISVLAVAFNDHTKLMYAIEDKKPAKLADLIGSGGSPLGCFQLFLTPDQIMGKAATNAEEDSSATFGVAPLPEFAQREWVHDFLGLLAERVRRDLLKAYFPLWIGLDKPT